MSQTIERPRTGGPGSGLGGAWRVIVLNDDHNTFDHVAKTLARFIPGVNVDQGYALAERIHSTYVCIGIPATVRGQRSADGNGSTWEVGVSSTSQRPKNARTASCRRVRVLSDVHCSTAGMRCVYT